MFATALASLGLWFFNQQLMHLLNFQYFVANKYARMVISNISKKIIKTILIVDLWLLI